MASASPVARFVAPGPSVARQTPAPARQAPVDVGHERRTLLVADRDEPDLGVQQDVVEVQRLLTRNPEDELHTFVL